MHPVWQALLDDPTTGLVSLLAPIAPTPTARTCLSLISTRVGNARIEPLRLEGAAVEHEEQLSARRSEERRTAIVLDLHLDSGGERRLVLGPVDALVPTVLCCDEATMAPSMKHSVWARDDFKFEGAESEVIDTLMECACGIEFGSTQWVVAWDPAEPPRYLVTSLLDADFSGERGGDLEYDELDPTLSLPELFLRYVAAQLVPVREKKLAFHPDAEFTASGVVRPPGSRTWPALPRG